MVFEEFADFVYNDDEEKFLTEYIATYSKYLITSDFDLVKDKMIDLAKRGHVRSLAKYLKRVKPENWDNELREIGSAIKNRAGAKTPQEWEVVAAIESHEPINYDKIKNVEQMREAICLAAEDYYYADQFRKAGQLSDEIVNEKALYCRLLLSAYEIQPYMQAVKKVQEGYYSAYVEKYKPLDAVGYLEFTLEPEDQHLDDDKFMQYGNGVYYSKQEIAKFLIDEFNNYGKKDDVPYDVFFGYGFAKTLYGKGDKEHMQGVRVFNLLSKMPIDDVLKPTKPAKKTKRNDEREKK